MDSPNCIGYMNSSECMNYCNDDYDNMMERHLDAPMPWIGMYIAAASAVCTLAMAADAFKGFRTKKFWFPCKYFSLNAFSLTLLTVAMKLPVDLTTVMYGVDDKISGVSSLVMMSTAIGNFMTSMACMDNNEILLSLTALGILVITISGNVLIHNFQTFDTLVGNAVFTEQLAAIVFMLGFLIRLVSLAVFIPTAKRYIDSKYQEMHKTVSNERVEVEKLNIDELRVVVKKYWVMAETGNPQFVISRSVVCVTSGVMCLLMALTLVEAHVRMSLFYKGYFLMESNYKWSINWILVIQSVGVAVGSIAPVLRWFAAARFKSSKIGLRSFKDELKIETFWIQKLVEWRESSLPLCIQHLKCRKVLHDAKRLLLNVFIGIQILIVWASKLVLLISATCAAAPFLFFHLIKKIKIYAFRRSKDRRGLDLESRVVTELDFSRYVLLLEGEPELPQKTLANICNEVDNLIKKGKRQQPKNLIKLLHKSKNFNGVREFDNNQIPCLHSQEPPNCWSLTVVTLTSIAISLANISNPKAAQLLTGVNEGLSFAKNIEKTFDIKGEFLSIRNAADVIWVGVELYHTWQDKVLQKTGPRDRTHKKILQELSDVAEKTVLDFKTGSIDTFLMENPLNWPVKIIAANSMYRITRTLLLSPNHRNIHQTDEDLFEKLSVIISDILAACLTNLARVITIKCYSNDIKEREQNVGQAAILLGESEEILEILQNHQLPSLDPDKAAYIEEWRAIMEQQDGENPLPSITSNENAFPQSSGEYVSIELDV